MPPAGAPLVLRGRRFDASRPAVMAVVNRTPDSFYAAARHDLAAALERLEVVLADGADIVDVGGVRAGQQGEWVDAEQELGRVRPFLEAARDAHPEALLSLDTWRSEVARGCEGLVDLVNDTWAGHDPQLVVEAARQGCGYVVSHTGGLPPRTDPQGVSYGPGSDDVVADVLEGLAEGARRAVAAGVAPEAVLVDATLDFGKTTVHSLRLVAASDQIVELGFPVLAAISRKDFVGETLDLPVEERLEGSLAATAVAAWLGAGVFRTHDVRATRRVLDMVASIRGDRPPARAERGL
ncbi:dihydropteroate synthase [Luteococcus peritonei]